MGSKGGIHTHTHPSPKQLSLIRKNFQHVRHVAFGVHFKNSDPHFFSFSYSVSMVLMDNIPGPFAMLQMLTVFFFVCVCVFFEGCIFVDINWLADVSCEFHPAAHFNMELHQYPQPNQLCFCSWDCCFLQFR